MFASTSPAFLGVPRVFLCPEIPGWESPSGSAVLPLMMDGSGTDLGISVDDEEGLFAWMRSRSDYIASSGADFNIYPTEAAYRSTVQPNWLKLAAVTIGNTIRKAKSLTPPNSSLSAPIYALSEHWGHIQPLFSAALYLGEGDLEDTRFALFTQDLGLYGKPATGSLSDLISLLDVFSHIDQVLRAGLTDRIFVQRKKEKVELYDAQSDADEFRTICVYQEDAEGLIHPFTAHEADIHPVHEVFLRGAVAQNAQLLGAYLMAHMHMNENDLRGLRSPKSLRSFLLNRAPECFDDFDLMASCLKMALDYRLAVS